MSYEVGIETVNLRGAERLAHTEYCSNDALKQHVRAGTGNQRGLVPGVEGEVVHCFIDKCRVEPATWWGVREGD